MKTQKVSVDVWAMAKSMAGYVGLAILGGILLRLVIAAITLPKRLKEQKDNVQKAMDELKRKYPEAFNDVSDEIDREQECIKKEEDEHDTPIKCIIPVADKKIN